MNKASYFPHKIIQVSIIMTMLLCGGVVWHVWKTYEKLKSNQTEFTQIQELMGIISYLDEVMTMSARMGAATGDAAWEKRYRRSGPGLDDAIRELHKLSPDISATSATEQAETANLRLMEMETQAFSLTRQGKHQKAMALLLSKEYEDQKQLYAEGVQRVAENLYKHIKGFHNEERWQAVIAALILISALLLLSFIWMAVLRIVRRHVIEQKNAEEKLSYLAHHDSLTGLPNRLLFQDRLKQSLFQANRTERLIAVFFIDLDRFKRVNDTLGHTMGDLLLTTVGERLIKCVRESDTVARLGGDEFTIILTNLTRTQDAGKVAQKVLRTLSQPYTLNDFDLFMTASVGITISPSDGKDVDTLLRYADTAMYRAKEQGKNNYQFYMPEMNTAASERLELENSLGHAIGRGELLVHYQPQIDLNTGKVTGMEALVRWNHPHMGLISPAKFIPVAEETGVIIPISEWVLRTACAQNRAWHDAGFSPIHIAVNISARQFKQRGLVEMVSQVLKDVGLDPSNLELELTESIIMQNAEATVLTLSELKKMGIRLSVDDFGTGYSSLSYLKRFPIDTLKIDPSFVHNITSSPKDEAIATAIITLAHSLKMKVIAEGVETEEQLIALRSLRCDGIQGYLISRPLPAEAASVFLLEDWHLTHFLSNPQ